MNSDISPNISPLPTLKDAPQSPDAEEYKDDMFYFSLATFKVENCLFRVPRHELEQQSCVFRDMFTMPSAEDGGNCEGSSDGDPIHLAAATTEGFKLLLKLLYPPQARDISSSLTFEQCVSLLELSRMWQFERIFSMVKDRIRSVLWPKVACANKITLAHDYNLEDWYKDAYHELAIRTEPLSIQEGKRLGLEFSIKMGQVRENVAAARRKTKEQAATEAIDKIFFKAPSKAKEENASFETVPAPEGPEVVLAEESEEAPAAFIPEEPALAETQVFNWGAWGVPNRSTSTVNLFGS